MIRQDDIKDCSNCSHNNDYDKIDIGINHFNIEPKNPCSGCKCPEWIDSKTSTPSGWEPILTPQEIAKLWEKAIEKANECEKS